MLDAGEVHHGEVADVRPDVPLEGDLAHEGAQDFGAGGEEGVPRGGAGFEAEEEGDEGDDGGFADGGVGEGAEEGGGELGGEGGELGCERGGDGEFRLAFTSTST